MALAGLAALAAPAVRAATSWPDRPVRLIVPFGAGGAIDTLSRTVAQGFPAQARGQTLVVENRSGANGTVAGALVAQSKPDGLTLMMADLGPNVIGKELQPSVPYNPLTAFTPICHLVNLPPVLLVPAALPVRTPAELFEMARRRNGEMPYAHPGIGYVGHLAQELMLKEAGIRMTAVPYRSGAEVARSLLANETQSSIITVSTSLPFIREGKLRALAVTGAQKVPALPELPLLSDTLPGFRAAGWHGVVGPAGLPPEIVAAANAACNGVLATPEAREAITQRQWAEIVGGTPEQFGDFMQAESARWTPLIRALGLRAE
ncbi:MAG TPA: tripartite tricarboxylate transporter substrate-binding protein [Crenalkalicoccus sp.]|nr:tripartite tricarboxylate transporter substrate-binding protein [Crenalkalicoccus sp.]